MILALLGSRRSQLTSDKIKEILNKSDDYDDLYNYIYHLGNEASLSNSEGLALSSLYGAQKNYSGKIEIIHLKELFDEKGNFTKKNKQKYVDLFNSSKGILISTPVYFGARSSYLQEFIDLVKDQANFKNKICGVVSAGAKRNGGQETTNIYTLSDMLNLGAKVVGNGPPTSQYGGTGYAGDLGSILDDNFGLQTSYGTGKRVGQIANLIKYEKSKSDIDLTVVTFSEAGKTKVKEKFDTLEIQPEIIAVNEYEIKKCIACPSCPNGNLDSDYKCVVDDDLEIIRKKLGQADAIILSKYMSEEHGYKLYQRFIERTRFVRRNDFELTNTPIALMSFLNDSVVSNYRIKAMTSILRQNTIICGPPYVEYKGDSNKNFKQFIDEYFNFAKRVKKGVKDGVVSEDVKYVAIGYGDKDDKES